MCNMQNISLQSQTQERWEEVEGDGRGRRDRNSYYVQQPGFGGPAYTHVMLFAGSVPGHFPSCQVNLGPVIDHKKDLN